MFLFAMTVLIVGCSSNDECDESIEGGNLTLSDSLQNQISNYLNGDKIVFLNQIGSEVKYSIERRESSISNFSLSVTCEVDDSRFQTVIGTSESIELVLVNDSQIGDSIFITLFADQNPDDEKFIESLIVSCGKLFSDSFEQSDVLYTNTEDLSNLVFHDSLQIRNKTFYSVYESSFTNWVPKLNIKYTFNEGIVYIEDSQNSIELLYERKE